MKTCFLIAPIGEPQSAARKRTDKLEKFILKSTLTQLGYSLTRADRLNSTGIITGQIVRELLSADLVIADITDHNPNVFYEMGIRHATRRPIIHLRHKDVTIPFDTASMRTFEYSFDVEDRPACIKALSEALNTLQPSSENPFSAATQSYLVIRGEALHSPFRSLDLVQTIADVHALTQSLLDSAGPEVFYWGQTVGGTTVSSNFQEAVQAAVAKGATFKFIINDNPPYSTRMVAALEQCSPKAALDYRIASDCNTRFFACGTSQMMIGARIDGINNAFIIRDADIIRFVQSWFLERFNRLPSPTKSNS